MSAGGNGAQATRLALLRVIVVVTVVLGVNYIAWRWIFSLNWTAWWIAIPLVVAETYSLIDVSLFGLTVWRSRTRAAPPSAAPGRTVDVFITTFNEPVDLVVNTARHAKAITYPHSTWILDDGARPEMADAAAALGIGYIKRSADWNDRPLHAKAGNLNNALLATEGEFVLVLDADQVPQPEILDRTLGYFDDPRMALVQTPQYFGNVPHDDPLGSQAPLFYGPIQQGKDGWNAAFFCGSNAILRREALMQLGVSRYVRDVERAVLAAFNGSHRVLKKAARSAADNEVMAGALAEITSAVETARAGVERGESLSSVTYALQQRIDEISRGMVAIDMHLLARDLVAIGELTSGTDAEPLDMAEMQTAVDVLAARDLSPLGAVESVRVLLRSIDVDRSDEAQPLMPLATISVTEDMATAMRLHATGWNSAYHHEVLAVGLAPDDLGTMLKQRLRWAQGTMQVFIKENPLVQRGLGLAQKLMYFSTMWSYLSGFAALVYFAAPVIFLCLGILPVNTTAWEFFVRFLPFMIANQLMFVVAGHGIPTWRGQQFSLALFPVWIRATTTAVANVFFNRPLGFVVTPKERQAGGPNWRLVAPQAAVAAVLVLASLVGVARLVLHLGEPIGTAVNLAWVVFDLVILSVLVPAVRYRGHQAKEENN
jgi:cellulose synthase (UDP-forming)